MPSLSGRGPPCCWELHFLTQDSEPLRAEERPVMKSSYWFTYEFVTRPYFLEAGHRLSS